MNETTEYGSDSSILNTPIVFRRRPLSLPEDLRPVWRIGLLILILNACCRGGRSSRARLHVLSWGIRTQRSYLDLLAAVSGELNPSSLIVRFDPFLDRALDFAIGEGLIRHDGGKSVALTLAGKQQAEEIQQTEAIFAAEKEFIKSIQKRVSEDLIKQMFGWSDE